MDDKKEIEEKMIESDEKAKEEKEIEEIKDIVRERIGRFAAPDTIHITSSLPKTRSGKVMRRILRKIASGDHSTLGDTSTLNEPQVVDVLIKEYLSLKK